MKNIVKLDNYFSPDELEAALQKFVDYYNTNRYHESLNNLTPEDVYYGRGDLILRERERIKTQSLTQRKNEYQKNKLQKTTLLNTNFVNLNLTKHSLTKSSH
jgi:hypothetical protein